MDSLPKPYGDLFDHEAFWSDSLLRAMLSGSFTKARFRDQMEDAFTASLLADVAVPVLLSSWREYYEPVFAEWREGTRRLSEIEREHFGWDHAQAGAWVVQSWEFPEDMICYIGAHNLSLPSIQEHELGDTILVPMAVASIAPSVLKSGAVRSAHLYAPATEWLSIDGDRFVACVREVQDSFADMLELLELPDRGSSTAFDDLLNSAGPERSVEGT